MSSELYPTGVSSISKRRLIDSFVIQISDGGGGDKVHFVLDRKADQPHLWLMPGRPFVECRYLTNT